MGKGRRPLPDHLRKTRRTIFVTDAEWSEVCRLLGREVELEKSPESPVGIPYVGIPMVPLPWMKIEEEPYQPSMRECSICGKDYDGNEHDKCPHPHEPNNKGKR